MVDSILKEVAIDNINFLHHWKFKMLFYKNAFSIRFLFLVFKRKHNVTCRQSQVYHCP